MPKDTNLSYTSHKILQEMANQIHDRVYFTESDDRLCAGSFSVHLPPQAFRDPLNEIHFSVYNDENIGVCVHHPMIGEIATLCNMAVMSLGIIISIGIYLLLKKLYRQVRR
jgi:hypothetical protein